MRWTTSKNQRALKDQFNFKSKKEEIVERFLWLPLQLNDQWRWLEWAKIKRIVWFKSKRRSIRYYWAFTKWVD